MLFARLDFICTDSEIKLLECNFDAPGLLVETFEIGRLACAHMELRDPNADGRTALVKCLLDAVKQVSDFVERPTSECNVVVCSRGCYERDLDASIYLASLIIIFWPYGMFRSTIEIE